MENQAITSAPLEPQTKKSHPNLRFIIPIVILALSTCGLAGYLAYDKLTQQDAPATSSTTSTTKDAQAQTIVTESSSQDIASATFSDDYVYLPQWGIKIKTSDKLKSVSYLYNSDDNNVGFWGAPAGYQYFPEFADPATYGIPALIYLWVSSSDVDCTKTYDAEKGCPLTGSHELVYSTDQYNIYFENPQAVNSRDANSQQDEPEAVSTFIDVFRHQISEI